MAWNGLSGHDELVERFRESLKQGRLGSTYLFVGPPGVGKHAFALRLAQSLLCEASEDWRLDPCGKCPGCIQTLAGTHPDLHLVAKDPDRSFIPVAAFIGDEAHRMREGLCHWIGLKPFRGKRKIAIVDDADMLNEEGANCLLKTLEEPPPQSLLILVGTSAEQQLPTIRSRAQIVRFQPLPSETVAELLVRLDLVKDPAEARRIAEHSGGSLDAAAQLADPELWKFRAQLLSRLATDQLDAVKTAKTVATFVEEAGKDAPVRRQRARQVVGFAMDFYRELMRRLSGCEAAGDAELRAAAGRTAESWRGDAEMAAMCLERCLETLAHIDRNANQATLIDCWFDDLAGIVSGRNSMARSTS